jgi:hypothetical protein
MIAVIRFGIISLHLLIKWNMEAYRLIALPYTGASLTRAEQDTEKQNQTPWRESACELYQPRNRRLLEKLVPNSTDSGCHVVSETDSYVRILGSLERSSYFFFQVAPQLYSPDWVDPVPDPLFLGKSGSAGNRTRTSGSVDRDSDQ